MTLLNTPPPPSSLPPDLRVYFLIRFGSNKRTFTDKMYKIIFDENPRSEISLQVLEVKVHYFYIFYQVCHYVSFNINLNQISIRYCN